MRPELIATAAQQMLSTEEIARRGEAIYVERLREIVETPDNLGKILVLDVETGDYEIDASGLAANDRLQERRPDGLLYGLRVGFDVVEGIGGFAPQRRSCNG